MVLRPQISPIPWLFHLRFATNTGAAFSLLHGFLLGVTLLSAAILAAILIHLARTAQDLTPLGRMGRSLLLGGSTGNLLGRSRPGYVVDYVDLYAGRYHWPTFNLADSAMSIRVGLLALASCRDSGPRRPTANRAAAGG